LKYSSIELNSSVEINSNLSEMGGLITGNSFKLAISAAQMYLATG